jgi:hypothetical protein
MKVERGSLQRMKISNPSLQQRKQVFMETFSNALNDEEESRIYDQAFDTFSLQSESRGASFDEMPTYLAAHTFNTAKSSLSALMPSAELPEIRAAAEELSEVAKWVNLLDTSSEFLEAATEQTAAPLSQKSASPVSSPPPKVSTAPSVIYSEPPKVLSDKQQLADARSKLEQALSLSNEASSGYSSAAQSADGAGQNMGQASDALSDGSSRQSSAGAAVGLGQSAEASDQHARESGESARTRSAETEQLIESARYLIADDRVAHRLDELVDLCQKAQSKGKEGKDELDDAHSSLRSALSDAQYIADSPKDAQLALAAIEAAGQANDSRMEYFDAANDFEDAGREQNQVTSGLQEVLGDLSS